MMIQMFVHAAAPVLRRERSEEWMRMTRALRLATLIELANLGFTTFALAREVAGVRYHQPLIGRAIS